MRTVLNLVALAVALAGGSMASGAACRDPLDQPFASTSIWNTPIGSDAKYVPANLFVPSKPTITHFHHDDDHVWIPIGGEGAVTVPWYAQGFWGHPDKDYCTISGPFLRNISIQPDLSLELFGHNNGAGLLLASGEEYIETQPVYRCGSGTAPFFSQKPFCKPPQASPPACTASIRGNGTHGAHGGSHLSAVGGTVRAAEILPDAPPIAHALKLELSAKDYYFGEPPGYVWPALNCDGYAFNNASRLRYGGTNPLLSPGTLLAVPPAKAEALALTTAPARRLLAALTSFGGYLVDDTASEERGTICTQNGFGDAFAKAYGFQFNATGSAFAADMVSVFQQLHIVANNGPSSVGGGGSPLVEPPPPLCPPSA